MTTTQRCATFFPSFLLIVGMAAASQITLLSVGNGTGLSDGTDSVGFATLMIDGKTYIALCIDSLHEASVGNTWSGIVSPLTDTAALTPIIHAQFGNLLTAAIFDPKLGADVVGFDMILGNPGDALVTSVQHGVWGQFDPKFDGQALALSAASILQNGVMSLGAGGQMPVSINGFSIVTDSSNVTQAFIVASTPSAPEPVTLGLVGAGLVLLGLLRRRGRI